MTGMTSSHVSWTKLWVVIGIFFAPCFGGLIMVVRGSQQIVDGLAVVNIKLDKNDNRMDKIEEKINQVSIRVDTIYHRQDINNVIQNFRYQMQQQNGPTTYRTQTYNPITHVRTMVK
jgi:hypothetical protein